MFFSWLPLMEKEIHDQLALAERPISTKVDTIIARGPEVATIIDEDGSTLDSVHYLANAMLHHEGKHLGGGTFLLPSIKPETVLDHYVVAREPDTGLNHIVKRPVVMPRDGVKPTVFQNNKKHAEESFREAFKDDGSRVAMPSHAAVFSEEKKAMMPHFGSFPKPQGKHLGSIEESTVSIAGAFKDILGVKADHLHQSGNIRDAHATFSFDPSVLSFIPRQTTKSPLNPQATVFIPSNGCASPDQAAQLTAAVPQELALSRNNAADKKFFEGLLTKDDKAKDDAADKIFFESLINGGEEKVEVPNGTKQPETKSLELDDEALYTLSSLDLASIPECEKPLLRFSELDLDVTARQIRKYLNVGEADAVADDEDDEAIDYDDFEEPQYRKPNPPRTDILKYGDYFPPPRSLSISTTGSSEEEGYDYDTDASDHETPVTSGPTTPERRISGAADDLALVLKPKSSKPFNWLDLAESNCFQRLIVSEGVDESSSVADSFTFDLTPSTPLVDDSTESEEEEIVEATVRLPSDDARADAHNISTVQCVDETFLELSSSPLDDFLFKSESDTVSKLSTGLQQPVEPNVVDPVDINTSPKDLGSIDLGEIFGGSLEWADDSDVDQETPDEHHDDDLLCEETSDENDDDDADVEYKSGGAEEGNKTATETTYDFTSYPLALRESLPFEIINDFNFEFCKMWNEGTSSGEPYVYGRDEAEVNTKVLELLNLKHADVPITILDMVSDANHAFDQLRSETPMREEDAPKFGALALANVEWFYFARMLKQQSSPLLRVPASLALEAAEPAITQLKELLGLTNSSYAVHFHQTAPKTPVLSNVLVSNAGALHHINFNGDWIYERSFTTPEISFFAICSTKYKQLLHNGRAVRSVDRKAVLAAQAFKYVDPVQYRGSDEAPPLELHGQPLTGSRLRDYVTGQVDVVYQPYGTWTTDKFGSNDNVPIPILDGDQYHHGQMVEYMFQHPPLYIQPDDLKDKICNVNDDENSRRRSSRPRVLTLTSSSYLRKAIQTDKDDYHPHTETVEDLSIVDNKQPSKLLLFFGLLFLVSKIFAGPSQFVRTPHVVIHTFPSENSLSYVVITVYVYISWTVAKIEKFFNPHR